MNEIRSDERKTMQGEFAQWSVTYFPHLFLEDGDLKRLALYFPSTRLLQVVLDFNLGLPASVCNANIVQTFCPLADSATLQSIERAHRTYRQLGSLYRDGGLKESFRLLALQEDPERTRTSLVAHLKGARPKLTPQEVELVDAAVFLLLAHEADREHLELEKSLDRIRGLEAELQEVLGMTGEEEVHSGSLDLLLPEDLDRARRGQPLQRLRAWTRLYLSGEDDSVLLPLTTSIEVMEEIFERLPPQLARFSTTLPAPPPAPQLLCRLPDPQPLSLDDVLTLRDRLNSEGVLNQWWQTLTTALHRLRGEMLPEEEWLGLRRQLETAVVAFQQHWPEQHSADLLLELGVALFPRLQPASAFALASGLRTPDPEVLAPAGTNGTTLLLAPPRTPPAAAAVS